VVRTRVGGLDGCRGGWVLATVPAQGQVTGPEVVEVTVVASVEDVVQALDAGDLAAVAVDIPIGLLIHQLTWDGIAITPFWQARGF
jgi:predicted RNase H-like nuclease